MLIISNKKSLHTLRRTHFTSPASFMAIWSLQVCFLDCQWFWGLMGPPCIFLSSVLSYSLFKGEEDGITTLPALKYPKLSIIDVSCNTFKKVTTPTDSRFFWIERQHIRSNSFCASLTIICNIKVISVVQCPFLFGRKPLLFHGRAFVENNNSGHENKVKTPLIQADALSGEQGCFRAEEKHQ